MKKLHFLGIFIAIVLIFAISNISAKTLITGKIYNSDYSNTISNASVTATCNSNILTSTSLADGSYAIGFDISECNETNIVNVNGNKGNLAGSGNNVLIKLTNSSIEYLSVINLNLIETSVSSPKINHGGGGRSGRYYLCGNNICDSGESTKTCPQDCPELVELSNKGNITLDNLENNETENNSNETSSGDGSGEGSGSSSDEGFVSGITGAVTGFAGTGKGKFALVFMVAILAIGTFVVIKQKKKKSKKI